MSNFPRWSPLQPIDWPKIVGRSAARLVWIGALLALAVLLVRP